MNFSQVNAYNFIKAVSLQLYQKWFLLRYKPTTLPEGKSAILLKQKYFTGILQGYYLDFNQFTIDF